VEIVVLKSDILLITSFLTSKPDPMRGQSHQPDDVGKMMLARSCREHSTQLLVFHDSLSAEFVAEQSDQFVRFHRVGTMQRSCNDSRYFFYREWLAENKVDYLFLSDLFDCHLNRNPSYMLPLLRKHGLLISHETDRIGEPRSKYVMGKLRQCYGHLPKNLVGKQILNAGLWGGSHRLVCTYLDMLCNEIVKLTIDDKESNVNMAAMNKVAYSENIKFWAKGWPLHSTFTAYEKNSTAVFSHK
jgi:hypothetical protein